MRTNLPNPICYYFFRRWRGDSPREACMMTLFVFDKNRVDLIRRLVRIYGGK